MHTGIKPKPHLSQAERAALNDLLNGPLISATHKPVVTASHLRQASRKHMREEIKAQTEWLNMREEIKAQTEWNNDPVPFNDEIPF